MNVLPLDGGVVQALEPSAVAARGGAVSNDLCTILTIIKFARTMAHLTAWKGTTLTHLTDRDPAEFHYGTQTTGVLMRPIDELGRDLCTDGTNDSLSGVYSVAILAVGLSLKEAN